MAGVTISASGSFDKTEAWLHKIIDQQIFDSLTHFGQQGVNALSSATPTDTGLTAASWYYEIQSDSGSWSIIWGNSNQVGGEPLAVMLQLGHGTGTGGYVAGRDYINPALQPLFDQIANEAWKAVTA